MEEYYRSVDPDAPSLEEMGLSGIFGDGGNVKADDDLFCLAGWSRNEGQSEKPVFMMFCGIEDFLYKDNCRFREVLAENGFASSFVTAPGRHRWGDWETYIRLTVSHIRRDEKTSSTERPTNSAIPILINNAVAVPL